MEKDKSTREVLADLCHKQWSGWMRYLYSKCVSNPDGTLTIPGWAVARWTRQMCMAYSGLSEEEKNSDREEADKFLAVIVFQEANEYLKNSNNNGTGNPSPQILDKIKKDLLESIRTGTGCPPPQIPLTTCEEISLHYENIDFLNTD